MTALVPTDFTARVIWLGTQKVPVTDLVITSVPVSEMPLGFAGYAEESHAGLTRPSCSRVLKQHPRNTQIRNARQLSIVSAEEMAEVAADLGLADWDHAWVGASLVLEGIPDLTHLPPSSRLQVTEMAPRASSRLKLCEAFITISKPGSGRLSPIRRLASDSNLENCANSQSTSECSKL